MAVFVNVKCAPARFRVRGVGDRPALRRSHRVRRLLGKPAQDRRAYEREGEDDNRDVRDRLKYPTRAPRAAMRQRAKKRSPLGLVEA